MPKSPWSQVPGEQSPLTHACSPHPGAGRCGSGDRVRGEQRLLEGGGVGTRAPQLVVAGWRGQIREFRTAVFSRALSALGKKPLLTSSYLVPGETSGRRGGASGHPGQAVCSLRDNSLRPSICRPATLKTQYRQQK